MCHRCGYSRCRCAPSRKYHSGRSGRCRKDSSSSSSSSSSCRRGYYIPINVTQFNGPWPGYALDMNMRPACYLKPSACCCVRCRGVTGRGLSGYGYGNSGYSGSY